MGAWHHCFLSYIEQCVMESGVQQSYSFYDSPKGGRQWRIGLHMCMYRHITPLPPPHTHTLKKQECTSNNLPSYHYAPPPSTSISLKDFSIVAFLEDTSGPNHKIPLMIHSLTGWAAYTGSTCCLIAYDRVLLCILGWLDISYANQVDSNFATILLPLSPQF